ncbi:MULTISPECIES: hypothetical protein [Klebsiella]|uniref:hypothetical protein n=1 Tax=Klebsiella TaxID=570 RepID=UPI00115E3768|nr:MULTISPECIES: hypothetical protein [Klebsiella]MCW9490382.1 hypothetical protein [Klebsiella michiganensis]VUT14254.1 hypothetical protein SB6413_06014 [Klebsiella pasteurii]HCZ9102352.1 hypothetical protein [Klebsiella michiganensis]
MKRSVSSVLLFSMVLIPTISYAKNNLITYTSNGNEFTLEKKCVKSVKMEDFPDGGKEYEYTSAFFNLKKEDVCFKKFGDFFKNNVGHDVTIKFNNEVLVSTKIVSPLTGEDGFSQNVPNKKLASEIFDVYK